MGLAKLSIKNREMTYGTFIECKVTVDNWQLTVRKGVMRGTKVYIVLPFATSQVNFFET